MRLIQQTPACSDFDVVLRNGEAPAYRVLVPERLLARNLGSTTLLHVVPGHWRKRGEMLAGRFDHPNGIELSVQLVPMDTSMQVTLRIRNAGGVDLLDVWADICAGVNHLPGSPGWCNRSFMSDLPLDRTLQGRYWYESITPHGLKALVGCRWVEIHPSPREPRADAVPLYFSSPGDEPNAQACACQAPSKDIIFFQSWKGPTKYVAPFPGNACMHMQPFMDQRIERGSTASIAGMVGMHKGSFRSLSRFLQGWLMEK